MTTVMRMMIRYVPSTEIGMIKSHWDDHSQILLGFAEFLVSDCNGAMCKTLGRCQSDRFHGIVANETTICPYPALSDVCKSFLFVSILHLIHSLAFYSYIQDDSDDESSASSATDEDSTDNDDDETQNPSGVPTRSPHRRRMKKGAPMRNSRAVLVGSRRIPLSRKRW